MIIVSKGKIVNENIKVAKIDEKFITEQISKVGIKSIKDLLILTINNSGKLYIQPKKGKFTTLETNYQGGNW